MRVVSSEFELAGLDQLDRKAGSCAKRLARWRRQAASLVEARSSGVIRETQHVQGEPHDVPARRRLIARRTPAARRRDARPRLDAVRSSASHAAEIRQPDVSTRRGRGIDGPADHGVHAVSANQQLARDAAPPSSNVASTRPSAVTSALLSRWPYSIRIPRRVASSWRTRASRDRFIVCAAGLPGSRGVEGQRGEPAPGLIPHDVAPRREARGSRELARPDRREPFEAVRGQGEVGPQRAVGRWMRLVDRGFDADLLEGHRRDGAGDAGTQMRARMGVSFVPFRCISFQVISRISKDMPDDQQASRARRCCRQGHPGLSAGDRRDSMTRWVASSA